MKPDMMEINQERLRELIAEKKCSYSQLGSICGCSKQHMYSIANHEGQKITKARFYCLVDFFACTPDYLQGKVSGKHQVCIVSADGEPDTETKAIYFDTAAGQISNELAPLSDDYAFRLKNLVINCAKLNRQQLSFIEMSIDNFINTSEKPISIKEDPGVYIKHRLQYYILPEIKEKMIKYIDSLKDSPKLKNIDIDKPENIEYINTQLGDFQRETTTRLKAKIRAIIKFQPSSSYISNSDFGEILKMYSDQFKCDLTEIFLSDPTFTELLSPENSTQEYKTYQLEILKRMNYLTRPFLTEIKRDLKDFIKKSKK